jgi:hypothetical protein
MQPNDQPSASLLIPPASQQQLLPAPSSLAEYSGWDASTPLPVPVGLDHVVGLYNLTADPGEHVNLRLEFPGVVAALVGKLERRSRPSR